METVRDIVRRIEPRMQCNCDLDNWSPEPSTGHSCVCRIHKAATEMARNPKGASEVTSERVGSG